MWPLTIFLSAGALQSPVNLSHTFQKGETEAFEVDSNLRIESKEKGISTWFPDSSEFKYGYTLSVQEVGAQGVAKIRYRRPSITKIYAEQFDRPEKTEVDKIGDDILLQISPANEILDASDVKHGKSEATGARGHFPGIDLKAGPEDFLKTFYSLALFTGSLESSIEFNPRLPFDKVKPGDTWKRTASYAPQKLKGSAGMAVQRLDYTYTYVGKVTSEGKSVDRVTATLHFETDVAAYIHQSMQVTSVQTHLRSLPVVLDATMEFDLSPSTHRTLRSLATSKGSFKVFSTEFQDEPVYEEKLTGETTLEPVAPKSKS